MQSSSSSGAQPAEAPRERIKEKTPDEHRGVLLGRFLPNKSDREHFLDFRDRMQRVYRDPTPADQAIDEIEATSAWSHFGRWLNRQEPITSWQNFQAVWNAYKQQGQAKQPRGRSGNYTGSGAHFAETPETLHLQPKAKAKVPKNSTSGSLEGNSTYQGRGARATAKGGARPRARKIELTKPVIPYHDIMNDVYYIK
jgi:hypothetical protein